jgi:hypothetical protein
LLGFTLDPAILWREMLPGGPDLVGLIEKMA